MSKDHLSLERRIGADCVRLPSREIRSQEQKGGTLGLVKARASSSSFKTKAWDKYSLASFANSSATLA
jgi:hypothetical protein